MTTNAEIQSKPKTLAERIKFRFEFMLLMLTTGRIIEAQQAGDEVFRLLDQLIKEA